MPYLKGKSDKAKYTPMPWLTPKQREWLLKARRVNNHIAEKWKNIPLGQSPPETPKPIKQKKPKPSKPSWEDVRDA